MVSCNESQCTQCKMLDKRFVKRQPLWITGFVSSQNPGLSSLSGAHSANSQGFLLQVLIGDYAY